MKQAIHKAMQVRQLRGDKKPLVVRMDMLREVGEGFYKGTDIYRRAWKVIVVFDQFGQPITAYPELPRR
jgi:hypothetical protein